MKLREISEKYEAEISSLRQKITELEEVVKKYEEIIKEQLELIDELVDKTKKTVTFFLVYMPSFLPENAKTQYKLMTSRIREIWGAESERGG